jgi:hypothetical protein
MEPRVDTAAAAKYIGRSPSWLNKERAAGRGPRFLKIGARVAYRVSDLDEYLDGRVRETSDTRRRAA